MAAAQQDALAALRRAQELLEGMLPGLDSPADHYNLRTALLHLDDAEEALVVRRLDA